MGLMSFSIKIWGKSAKGWLSFDRTSKQTKKQTEITTLYIYIDSRFTLYFPFRFHYNIISFLISIKNYIIPDFSFWYFSCKKVINFRRIKVMNENCLLRNFPFSPIFLLVKRIFLINYRHKEKNASKWI